MKRAFCVWVRMQQATRVGEGTDEPGILKVRKETPYFYLNTRKKKTLQNILSS